MSQTNLTNYFKLCTELALIRVRVMLKFVSTYTLRVSMKVWIMMRTKGIMRLKISQASIILI